ncbi:hypothetical protein OG539_38755 [Actinacidiphila glaucinigra]|uniref:hypothetical protein n=1 Tax=Actinacidiphila glaucinigra TaxID=235986 RepID=UPI002DDBDB94|nr:hypothetical protein [Actinacidiphila glaucinigra]WSD58251.1 hypothetical protein OIE69_04740 [Actinacidiphila glaucinigra]
MSNQTTTHHGPVGPAPGPAPGAQETGIDGLAHLVDDLAHAMATTPEAVLAGMSDDVLNALFRLHVRQEPAHGPRSDGVLEPGQNRVTR